MALWHFCEKKKNIVKLANKRPVNMLNANIFKKLIFDLRSFFFLFYKRKLFIQQEFSKYTLSEDFFFIFIDKFKRPFVESWIFRLILYPVSMEALKQHDPSPPNDRLRLIYVRSIRRESSIRF